MTKKELIRLIAQEQELLDKTIAEAKARYKAQCKKLRVEYIESNKPDIKVGDVIRGQIYFQGQQMTIKVKEIVLQPNSGYKYYGTRLTAKGEVAKHQFPSGTGLLQQYITSINGNPINLNND